MIELKININDHNQRLDRFLFKYMEKAPRGFIYKMIRRKNIEVNNKKSKPEYMLQKGDTIQLFLSEKTIEKFQKTSTLKKVNIDLDIIHEDKNILLINKKQGILSHGDGSKRKNIADGLTTYLINKGEYNPKKENTFSPSVNNRLDLNTSGIIIGSKNYMALKEINQKLRERKIKRYYLAIVKGNIKKKLVLEDRIIKAKNKMVVAKKGKKIKTIIRPIKQSKNFTLIEVELITGRTHQIRSHLSSIGYPIIGDPRYGDVKTNRILENKYDLKYQFLHSYKINFTDMKNLSYLNGKSYIAKLDKNNEKIKNELFN